MTEEERKEFYQMRAQIDSVYRVIVKNEMTGQPGIAQRVTDLEHRQTIIENKQKMYMWIMIGLSAGILIMGLIFGILSVRQLSEIIKTVK